MRIQASYLTVEANSEKVEHPRSPRARSGQASASMPGLPLRDSGNILRKQSLAPRSTRLPNSFAGSDRELSKGHRAGGGDALNGASRSEGAAPLEVPYVAQPNDYGCWHASMQMILKYHGRDDSHLKKLSYLYDSSGNPKPLDAGVDYKTRNKYAKLTNIPVPSGREWTPDILRDMLDARGPVEALLELSNGWEHNIVLIGASSDGNNVIFHDPATGPNQTMSFADLNQQFCWGRYKSALTAYGG